MRFIHTADWHLGKLFGERYMTDEQEYVLRELIYVVKETKSEVLIIAGDIYDRAVPPTEAVDLFSDILAQLNAMGVKTLAIAGNHDSASRLNFGADIMRQSGIYLSGKVSPTMKPVVIEDVGGRVYFSLIPYADPPTIKEIFRLEHNVSFNEGMELLVKAARSGIPEYARSVAISHAFITGGKTSDSERPLSVGSSEEVSFEHFADYNYTALGHLHAPQRAGADNIRYSGSLLKYSFDEANHVKGVNFIDMDACGNITREFYPLKPRHNVRIISGTLDELLSNGYDPLPMDDFVRVDLMDSEPVLFPFEKLLVRYKNLFALTRPNIHITNRDNLDIGKVYLRREKSEKRLFADFFKTMTKTDLTIDEEGELSSIIDEINRRERES